MSEVSPSFEVQVVGAAVVDSLVAPTRMLVAQRSEPQTVAGMWEFPGGKVEPGESCEQALVRELQEEVGITPLGATLFDKLEYQFPDRHITLWFWLVENWEGEPWGKEGQPGNWIELQASDAEKFPPANEPVILRLAAQP